MLKREEVARVPTLREQAALVAYRRQWGVPYAGPNILSDTGAGACNAVGTADAVLALLQPDDAMVERATDAAMAMLDSGRKFKASDIARACLTAARGEKA